jgi:cell wall-associated NlpC family hydrolase
VGIQGPAGAAVGALEEQLAAARAGLRQLQVEASQAVEAYDAAVARLHLAQASERAAVTRQERAAADARTARTELGRWAAATYRAGGPMAGWSAVLSAGGATELIRRAAAIQFVGAARTAALARAGVALAVADQTRLAAEQALDTVTSSALVTAQARTVLLDSLDARRVEVEGLEGEQQQLLALLAARQRTTIEREAARPAAAEPGTPPAAAGWSLPDPVPGQQHPAEQPAPRGTEEGGRRAVAFALAQVGKPYLWAGAGPDSFDCSGLTMRAWEQAGVPLPHYSAGQAQLVLPVPWDGIRPGDLVFFATNPRDITTVYHVALYVGDGLVVEAPRPGTHVRVAPVWQPGLLGAGRP